MPPEAERKDIAQRIDVFLGEFRIMVPALAALLGFQLIVAFQPTYDELPRWLRLVNLAGVASSALALLFLLVPSSYHRLAAELDESERFLRYAQRNIGRGFLFLAVSLALSLFLQAMRSLGDVALSALAAGAFLAALAAAWWWAPARRAEARRKGRPRAASPLRGGDARDEGRGRAG